MKSSYQNSIWTYDLKDAWAGPKVALLASYMIRNRGESLVDFLNQLVFSSAEKSVIKPDTKDIDGLTVTWQAI